MHFLHKRIYWLLVVWLCLIGPFASGQNRVVRKAERRKELAEKLEKKYYQQVRKKTIKHRREIQTKATRKRMKEADKRARKYNRQNHEGCLEQLFSRKKPRR